MTKKIIIIFLMVIKIIHNNVYAQAPIYNPHNYSDNLGDASNMLVRYWYYRWRLQNDFLIMGDQVGYSIPAEDREGTSLNSLRWGDGTIWLGNYICMLALENRLLRYNNRTKDLLKNEKELYYAMQAFNRLDVQGDTYYAYDDNNDGVRFPSSKNGFFMRDDVPANFFTTNYMDVIGFDLSDPSTWATTPEYNHFTNEKSGIYYHYKPAIAYSSGSMSKPNIELPSIPYTVLYGHYYVPSYEPSQSYIPISHADETAIGHTNMLFAMSQDQVYRLLMGFSTVIKSLSSGSHSIDTDDNGVGDVSFDFVEEAKIHSTNIIARTAGISQNTLNYQSNIHNGPLWYMVDPLNNPTGIGDWSGAFEPEVSMIWVQNYTTSNNLQVTFSHVLHAAFLGSLVGPVYLNIATQLSTKNQPTNAKLYLYTSIVSGLVPNRMNTHDGVFNHIFKNSRGNPSNTNKWFGWHTFMVPLYKYLHDFTPAHNEAINNWSTTKLNMFSDLVVAPCWGPYNYLDKTAALMGNTNPIAEFSSHYPGVAASGVNGWDTPFRFDQTAYTRIHGYGYKKHGDPDPQDAFFNGIDYMLELNLFYLTTESPSPNLPDYQNLIDRVVDYTVSSDDTPMLGAFNSITIEKPITGSGVLAVKAGEFIDLQDGTHIVASQPSKHFFIGTFSCGHDDFGGSAGYDMPLANTDSSYTATTTAKGLDRDYGFNEVFKTSSYAGVHAFMNNCPTTEEATRMINTYAINIQEVDSIVLYPNPTKDFFAIKNTNTNKDVDAEIHLYSAQGKEIELEHDRTNYNVQFLAPGAYLVKIIFPSGVIEEEKLIKIQ